MAHLFDKMMSKSRSKSSFEAVSKLTAALDKLNESSPEKLQEDISKFLALVKVTELFLGLMGILSLPLLIIYRMRFEIIQPAHCCRYKYSGMVT